MAYEASEIMTAAALQYTTQQLVDIANGGRQSIIDMIEEARKKISSGKSSVYFGNDAIKKGFLDLMVSGNINDMAVAMSAATGIRKFMEIPFNTIPNVYMTGNVWPKDVEQFKVSAYGFEDYNSSDILVSYDKINYYGISLKKKQSVAAGDPTLINKAFDTIMADPSNQSFRKIKEDLLTARQKYFSSVILDAIKEGLIRWKDINSHTGQKFKTEKEFLTWAKTSLGQKELFTGSKRDKKLFAVKNYINLKGSAHPTFLKAHKEGYNWDPDKGSLKSYRGPSMRNFVNAKLAEKNNKLWASFIGVMNDNAEVFADALINVILKKYLYKEIDAKKLKKYKFHFALVTGIGVVSKEDVKIQPPTVIPLKTTLCGLTRIEEKFQRKSYEIVLDESKKEDSDAAKIFFKLKRGDTDILDLELRYKGDFNPQPQFQGGLNSEFKKLLESECDF
jgi:hypothetical protein